MAEALLRLPQLGAVQGRPSVGPLPAAPGLLLPHEGHPEVHVGAPRGPQRAHEALHGGGPEGLGHRPPAGVEHHELAEVDRLREGGQPVRDLLSSKRRDPNPNKTR